MRSTGKITSWNDRKGFGFVTPSTGGKRVFLHIKDFSNRNGRPVINQTITYAPSIDKQGRPYAVKARWVGERPQTKTKQRNTSLSVMAAALFLVSVSVSAICYKIPALILAVYLFTSLLTFMMYARDKSAARKGARRTRENTLHLLSLAGGWPGAIVAQHRLRHKSRKQPFRTVFWITVLMNCAVFVWLLSPSGSATLRSMLGSLL